MSELKNYKYSYPISDVNESSNSIKVKKPTIMSNDWSVASYLTAINLEMPYDSFRDIAIVIANTESFEYDIRNLLRSILFNLDGLNGVYRDKSIPNEIITSWINTNGNYSRMAWACRCEGNIPDYAVIDALEDLYTVTNDAINNYNEKKLKSIVDSCREMTSSTIYNFNDIKIK